jgi:hypothetical protein
VLLVLATESAAQEPFKIVVEDGLFVWPPRGERQPAYYAVLLLHDVVGLEPGAEMLAVTTSEEPKEVRSAVWAELSPHDLEPFAIRLNVPHPLTGSPAATMMASSPIAAI